jgi:hypothetical protein
MKPLPANSRLADDIIGDARDSLLEFDRQTERWNADSKAAERCIRLELRLAIGILQYNMLNRIDEVWRTYVLRGAVEYSVKMDEQIGDLYRLWYKSCARLLPHLAACEKEGFVVEGAMEFRSACREAEGILTPDDVFFSADALVELRDEAIEANRRGETAEIKSIGD